MFSVTRKRSHRARWYVDYALHEGLAALRANEPARSAFARVIQVVRSQSDLLRLDPSGGRPSSSEALHFAPALVELSRHVKSWQRDVEAWTPPTASRFRQFASLAEHLLALSPVPRFLAKVWLEQPCARVRQHQKWFKHLGLGHDVRGLQLPLRFSRKMADAFRTAPDDLSVHQALRWSQVRGLRGDPRLARAIAATRIGDDLSRDEYWREVIRFLIRHPWLALEHAVPVVEYLHAWKATPDSVLPRTLQDKTVGTFLQEVLRWWSAQCRVLQPAPLRWRPLPIRPYRLVDPGNDAWNYKLWTIEELLDGGRLTEEGLALHHCVGTYSRKCMARQSSIWSLKCHGSRTVQRIATIEVNPATRTVVTALGRCNTRLSTESRCILENWAEQEALGLATWI